MSEVDKEVVDVHYQKSPSYRVVLAEGVYGGLTPKGTIISHFFTERWPIPKSSSLTIVGGKSVSETTTEILSGVVRSVDVGVVMDFNMAVAYYHWLREKLEHLRVQNGISEAEWNKAMGLSEE